jgi:hypothetical protein
MEQGAHRAGLVRQLDGAVDPPAAALGCEGPGLRAGVLAEGRGRVGGLRDREAALDDVGGELAHGSFVASIRKCAKPRAPS